MRSGLQCIAIDCKQAAFTVASEVLLVSQGMSS